MLLFMMTKTFLRGKNSFHFNSKSRNNLLSFPLRISPHQMGMSLSSAHFSDTANDDDDFDGLDPNVMDFDIDEDIEEVDLDLDDDDPPPPNPSSDSSNATGTGTGLYESYEELNKVQCGIVHFGVGRFHRAHQAVFLNELAMRGESRWGICGVHMLKQDESTYNTMKKQQCKYNVVELGSNSTAIRKIKSIVDVIFGHDNPEDVFHTLSLNSIKIVSFSITKAGYYYNKPTKSLDFSDNAVAHDFDLFKAIAIQLCASKVDSSAADTTPRPRTIYGYLSVSLLRRYVSKVKPFTVLSCDNMETNGDFIKTLLLEFCHRIKASEPKLPYKYKRFLDWLDSTVTYPNSIADRVVPPASDYDFELLRVPLRNFSDHLPVTCEMYRQWIIENNFCNVKPDFKALKNAHLVPSIKPYERIRKMSYDGALCVLSYAAHLEGLATLDEIIREELFRSFLRLYLRDISAALEPAPPHVNIAEYHEIVVDRFLNPRIGRSVTDLCKNSSEKIVDTIIPIILDLNEKEASSRCLIFAVASWIAFIDHHRVYNRILNDEESEPLLDLIERVSDGNDTAIILRESKLFGALCENATFMSEVQKSYDDICASGVRAALRKIITAAAK